MQGQNVVAREGKGAGGVARPRWPAASPSSVARRPIVQISEPSVVEHATRTILALTGNEGWGFRRNHQKQQTRTHEKKHHLRDPTSRCWSCRRSAHFRGLIPEPTQNISGPSYSSAYFCCILYTSSKGGGRQKVVKGTWEAVQRRADWDSRRGDRLPCTPWHSAAGGPSVGAQRGLRVPGCPPGCWPAG